MNVLQNQMTFKLPGGGDGNFEGEITLGKTADGGIDLGILNRSNTLEIEKYGRQNLDVHGKMELKNLQNLLA